MNLDELRYPIGKFERPSRVEARDVTQWIQEIADLPGQMRRTVEPLTPAQLDTPYRPDGWTVRQVVHHVGDSHMNSLVRFKWALTEERPTFKPYYEDRWARLADYSTVPVSAALDFLDLLHARWVALLRSLSAAELAREFVHPETGIVRLDANIGLYAWHGRHHLAHITRLIEREGWERGR
jgi:hypothetical protein